MKKSLLILGALIATLSLTAFGYLNWNNTVACQTASSTSEMKAPNLVYDIDSRYLARVTKEQLDKANTIVDILPSRATQFASAYKNVRISILKDDFESDQSETGYNEFLTAAQIDLLQSTDYATNIFIGADYKIPNAFNSGELDDQNLTYYISIIPEKEAEYTAGADALIEYLKENSKEKTAIITGDKLKPGKVSFTVTQNGSIANVKMTSTCGYPSVDDLLVELISNMPEKWNPATNEKGEKVDQELVFFFGLQGC